MKPPPPILPASGYVTASVKAIATAASTALPPSLKICSAASALNLSATAMADAVSMAGWAFAGGFAMAGVASRKPVEMETSATSANPLADNLALRSNLIQYPPRLFHQTITKAVLGLLHAKCPFAKPRHHLVGMPWYTNG